MSFTIFLSFVLYSFVTSITPGPNNIMLAASGVNFGFKRSIPHILGIGCGFGFMVAVVGYGIGSVLSSNVILYESLKVIGIVYLLYLAYKIYCISEIDTDEKHSKPLTFIQAAMFQWVNPKAWVMALGAVTTYLTAESASYWYLILGITYGLVGIPSTGVWALIGEKLQKYIHDQQKLKRFNAVMALLLVLSVIQPLIHLLFFVIAFAGEH